jgi:hypothetical protein
MHQWVARSAVSDTAAWRHMEALPLLIGVLQAIRRIKGDVPPSASAATNVLSMF